jgi:hypothetical protein
MEVNHDDTLCCWYNCVVQDTKFQTSKMSDLLEKQGIFFDEVDKVCILEPEISRQTNELKEECQIYVESTK